MTTTTTPARALSWPLMRNNIAREDLDAACALLQQDDPILTQSRNVRAFEREWSDWLGARHSVFVNSGSSANLLTLFALRELYGKGGEVIVPTVTWVSDIAAVLHAGFEPVFVDIDPRTLGMDNEQVIARLNSRTRAVFLTHVLGYNGLTPRLLEVLHARGVPLLEDVCESHGATMGGRKLGSFGLASNFSFYYAHHMSTIEGGMICTNNTDLYEACRMLRGHGMVRELDSESRKRELADEHADLNPDFIFAYPGFNVRSTEINAVIGRSQLRRLDENNERRRENLRVFLAHLDPQHYWTDFVIEGSCNYAFTPVLRRGDEAQSQRVMAGLRAAGVELRRGTSGGGNQVRQPYLRGVVAPGAWAAFPNAEHVHFHGMYIGNYPGLTAERIRWLCGLLNDLAAGR